ncbi:MAG: alpha/beta hydrolase family protein [Promethearchaeota archaeon]
MSLTWRITGLIPGTIETPLLRMMLRFLGFKRVFKPRYYHWLATGADLYDLNKVLGRIRSRNQWWVEWQRLAEEYEHKGNRALAAGHKITARARYLRASTYFNIAQWIYFSVTPKKKDLVQKSVEVYKKAGELLQPLWKSVEIPFKNESCPGYLRLPSLEGQHPCILLIQGTGQSKEEGAQFEEFFIKRGLATLTLDGPGFGEARVLRNMTLTADSWGVYKSAIEYLQNQAQIYPDNISISGISMGGYLAIKTAAALPNIRACVSVAAPYDPIAYYDDLPYTIRRYLSFQFGLPERKIRTFLPYLSLKQDVSRLKCPLFIIHGARDDAVPVTEAYRLYKAAKCEKRVKIYTKGYHACVQRWATDLIAEVTDWLEERAFFNID